MNDNPVTPGDGASRRPLGELSDAAELKLLAESRPEELYEAADRLCRDVSDDGPAGSAALRTVGRFADVLAETRSRECARFAVDLVGRLLPVGPAHREEGDLLRRSVAAKLARSQQLRDLAPLFAELPDTAQDPSTDVRACLLGELALIGVWQGRPALDAYAERLRELGHPLAVLPRTRLDVEHRFTVRVRGLGSVKTSAQLRSRFPEVPPTDSGAAAGRAVGQVPDGTRARAASEPFTAGGWAREPEARFFTLPSPLDPDDFNISFVKELPLDCLAGEGTRRGGAVACRTAPDDVLNTLFAAAYDGGANGRAQGGAYARLYAWNSLYAFLGLPTDVLFLEAVGQALDHRWLRFMAFTDWFHHDTADEAFAVLDPTRTRVTVLAATDTDADADG
ncbi:DUF6183 family protein [Streptomyces rhizosphaerihabitans]|uniref:DUF6183 family protein n=1 Tax=Streptomyces rhizosphaerihabitans TaxID=1266770 RepID=UPI0021C08FD2|nr:DUF6183 family protein [Streptomyces rhizosphaerihabitans]MCT9006064.1 DUF6183 family protein [Streptomyces rhizosphaerihabitans]